MKQILFLLSIILLFLIHPAFSQNKKPVRAQVMILGSYHMHNPGLDVMNVQADDVLSEKRQKEMKELVLQLADFQPTMIGLEIRRGTSRDTATQKNYKAFREGNYELTRWEGEQIGFRLAKQFDHPKVYNIDVGGNFPFQDMMEYAQANGQEKWLNETMKAMEKINEEEEQRMKEQSITEQLYDLNRPEWIKNNHQIYVEGAQIGKGNDFPGADLLAEWYKRNARIFSNLYKITEGKNNERILVIFGAGHAHILRELVRISPDFELVEPNDFLGEEEQYLEVMKQHLEAVSEKDLAKLKPTIPEEGLYLLVLPDGKITESPEEFFTMHEEWFKEPSWTMESKVLSHHRKGELGFVVVESTYREPDRDGKPYFNKMIISYLLQQQDNGKWVVVKDHAASVKRSE